MRRLLPALLISLAACSPPDFAAKPEAATLSRAALMVRMTNGTTCRADLEGPAPWSGTLAQCGLAFTVTPTGAESPIRLAFDALIAAIRAGDLVAPMADIALTDAAGRTTRFASPVPLED